jgi:glycosyltransferase involved in cell wall biosynthesis
MRVAHFIQRYPPALGGSEAYFQRLSRFLAADGDAVTVFTTNAIDLEAFWSRRGRCLPAGRSVEDSIEVRRYPLWRFPGRRYLLKPLSLVPHRFWQCLTLPCNPISRPMWRDAAHADAAFDLVHASAFPYAFPIACGLRLARRLGIPFLLTPFLHLGDPDDPRDRTRRGYTRPALRGLLLAADRVFVQTDVERDALLGLGLPDQKIVLQGLGVEPAECTGGDRVRARQAWQIGAEEIVVGHLANNSEEKGSVDLLRAAEIDWNRGLRFRLVLAGPEMPNFRRFWQSFTAVDQVRRLGALTEEQKRDFFAGIDVFALPSRSDSFGLVLLEAWANGVPNLAYRAGGVPGVIRHGEDGILVPCGNIQSLADALARLVSDQGWRRELGRKGQERIGQDFRWPEKLRLVRDVYEAVTCRAFSGVR